MCLGLIVLPQVMAVGFEYVSRAITVSHSSFWNVGRRAQPCLLEAESGDERQSIIENTTADTFTATTTATLYNVPLALILRWGLAA